MTDTHSQAASNTAHADTPQRVDVKARKRRKFSHVWWLPLLALLMSLYLAYEHFSSLGPIVNITFPDAEGLEADKTKLRYKNVEIGKVTALSVADDFSSVTATVRADKNSAKIFNENSRFWIVKPRLGLTEVTGLNTIVSGTYITVDPGSPDGAPKFDFVGLDSPPVVSSENDGLRVTLLSDRAQAVRSGSAIFYKGIEVGQVEQKEFTDDYLWVKINLVINKPYHTLINNNSRFYVTSGIIFEPANGGIKFEFESLRALVGGGIAFYTPPDELSASESVPNGTEFMLFKSLKDAQSEVFGVRKRYVAYFDGSVKGLEEGSAVEFNGLKVGEVTSVQMIYDPETNLPIIPIVFELFSRKLVVKGSDTRRVEDAINVMLKNGLTVSMATGNLLTGAKVLSLDLAKTPPTAVAQIQTDELTGYPELPSGSGGGFGEITEKITGFVDQLNGLPIEDLGNNVNGLVGDIRQTLSSGDVNSTIRSVDALVNDLRKVVGQSEIDKTLGHVNNLLVEGKTLSKRTQTSIKLMEKTVSQLSIGLQKSMRELQKTMAGFNADAPLYYNLNETILELNKTLKSIKRITDTLERQPNALIFGEEISE